MPAFTWSELEAEAVDGEQSPVRAPVYRGERIEAARVLYGAGAEVTSRASRHEQIHSILAGRAMYRVGGEEKVVGPGEAVLIRPNAEYALHAVEALEVVVFGDMAVAGPAPGTATKPAFYRWSDMKADFITPRYSSGRGPTITGERIEVAFMFYPAGTEGKLHSHPNEQIQVPLAGKVRGMIGGQECVIGPGDGVLFPANVEHGIEVIEDYTTINGKDIVPGFSVYHARWERGEEGRP